LVRKRLCSTTSLSTMTRMSTRSTRNSCNPSAWGGGQGRGRLGARQRRRGEEGGRVEWVWRGSRAARAATRVGVGWQGWRRGAALEPQHSSSRACTIMGVKPSTAVPTRCAPRPISSPILPAVGSA
jgi:hypothetical protein